MMLVLLLCSGFAFACSKLELEIRGNLAFKLHKFGLDLLKVVSDCVDLAQHALVKIMRSLLPCLIRPLDLSVEFKSLFLFHCQDFPRCFKSP